MIYVMEFIEKIYPGFQNFLSFLTGGSFCLCCGTKTYAIPLCKNCQSRVKKIESFSSSKRCKKCGKILVSEIELCSECRKKTEKSSCRSKDLRCLRMLCKGVPQRRYRGDSRYYGAGRRGKMCRLRKMCERMPGIGD